MKDTLLTSLHSVLMRDLGVLEKEISLYKSEESLWIIDKSIKNSSGNLCLHLCGNLNYYIGNILGKHEYVRDRDAEFCSRNIPSAKLVAEIKKTKAIIDDTVLKLKEDQLNSNFPVEVFGKPMTTLFFLIHLTAHFSYHLGQINYHRRLLG